VHVAARPTPDAPDLVAEQRFLLLETLREYAREQLTVNQEVGLVQQQHAAYYLQVAETGESAIRSTQGAAWLEQLETDHNNLRAALTWALATGDSTTALRLCGTLQWLWSRRGHVQEGKQWLEKSLAIPATAPLAVRAQALSASGRMDHILGNHAQAQRLVEQSLALYQTENDEQEIAGASLQLGGIHRKQHHYEQAEFFYQQGFNWFQAHEDKWGIAAVHIVFGHLSMNRNDFAKARYHYELGLALQRELGDLRQITNVLAGLAALAFQQGEYQHAVLYCEELLVRAKELGDSEDIVNALTELGRIALHQGDFARATDYLTQSFALAQELGYPPILALNLTYQGDLALAQADFVYARQCYDQSLQIAHQVTEKLDIATGLENLAGVANAQADAKRTIQLLGAAAKLRAEISVPLPARDQSRYQQITTAARAQLDETTYASAYAAGYTMTADQAVAFVLNTKPTSQDGRPQGHAPDTKSPVLYLI